MMIAYLPGSGSTDQKWEAQEEEEEEGEKGEGGKDRE